MYGGGGDNRRLKLIPRFKKLPRLECPSEFNNGRIVFIFHWNTYQIMEID